MSFVSLARHGKLKRTGYSGSLDEQRHVLRIINSASRAVCMFDPDQFYAYCARSELIAVASLVAERHIVVVAGDTRARESRGESSKQLSLVSEWERERESKKQERCHTSQIYEVT